LLSCIATTISNTGKVLLVILECDDGKLAESHSDIYEFM